MEYRDESTLEHSLIVIKEHTFNTSINMTFLQLHTDIELYFIPTGVYTNLPITSSYFSSPYKLTCLTTNPLKLS